jgi:hypothetical protein
MSEKWLIRAGENGELVDEWRSEEITTIGWDVGDLTDDDPGWEETKAEIVDSYNPNDPGQVTGRVRTFASVRGDSSRNITPGDQMIVLGDASVVYVAKVGEYHYVEKGLSKAPNHTYWRNIDVLQSGPVDLSDLPERFRQGGRDSLQLGPTLKSYNPESERAISDLISILEEQG